MHNKSVIAGKSRVEEMMIMFCLVRDCKRWNVSLEMVMEKVREDGEIGLCEKYDVLRRKFELDNKFKARNEKDWEEEIYTKSTLKWYNLANDCTGMERCEISTGLGECEFAV